MTLGSHSILSTPWIRYRVSWKRFCSEDVVSIVIQWRLCWVSWIFNVISMISKILNTLICSLGQPFWKIWSSCNWIMNWRFLWKHVFISSADVGLNIIILGWGTLEKSFLQRLNLFKFALRMSLLNTFPFSLFNFLGCLLN
jgi:hypothetical protein